jgi:hypothetical protein
MRTRIFPFSCSLFVGGFFYRLTSVRDSRITIEVFRIFLCEVLNEI